MSTIYEPRGKAREYSPLAVNFYTGCEHGCRYCYAPAIRRSDRDSYSSNINPRKGILHKIELDAKKIKYTTKQVLFNFMGDPYCLAEGEHKITRNALEILYRNKIPIAILTKGGNRALRDIDIMKMFGDSIQVGATLTFDNDVDSLEWEPKAALPKERLDMLKALHDSGVKTWASFEPVIKPDQSLRLIEDSTEYVDVYKIGKINNYNGIDKEIDWTDFLEKAVKILRENNKAFYVKNDLRRAAPTVKLYGNEVLADEHTSEPFDKMELFE